MILDTILDKAYRQLRNDLIIDELQEKAEAYDAMMACAIECPSCGENIAFTEDYDDGRIQSDDSD